MGRCAIDQVRSEPGDSLLYPFLQDGGIVDSGMVNFDALFNEGLEGALLQNPLLEVGAVAGRQRSDDQ